MIALICINFCLNILDFEFGTQYQEVEEEVDGEVLVTVEKVITEEYFSTRQASPCPPVPRRQRA